MIRFIPLEAHESVFVVFRKAPVKDLQIRMGRLHNLNISRSWVARF
ncbi:MAG: hypothetical protein IPP99_08705 [Chitinophagaceae bacterium]|nr:hypothetical protein [Chitinophagaceae bacterium]